MIAEKNVAAQNTARTPGWSWLASEALRCGDSGVVDEVYKTYPDPSTGYYVKFADGDRQSYVHANLRVDEKPKGPKGHEAATALVSVSMWREELTNGLAYEAG